MPLMQQVIPTNAQSQEDVYFLCEDHKDWSFEPNVKLSELMEITDPYIACQRCEAEDEYREATRYQ